MRRIDQGAGGGPLSAAGMSRVAMRDWVGTITASWSAAWFLTLSFRLTATNDAGGAVRLSEEIARGEVVLFGKRVDRAVHGRLVQRFNRRVPRVPFLEHGADRGWHCHMLIEGPYAMPSETFQDVLRKCWSVSPWATNCHIRSGDDGAVSYGTKARSKAAMEAWTDTLIAEAMFLSTK